MKRLIEACRAGSCKRIHAGHHVCHLAYFALVATHAYSTPHGIAAGGLFVLGVFALIVGDY
jgi:hypothetical protein